MNTIVPPRLQPGDEIRVLGLSRSLGGLLSSSPITQADVDFARGQLEGLGLRVSFGRRVMECNEHLTASPAARLEDLHEALVDPAVKGILAAVGGSGAIQLLDGIDYSAVAANPKVFCGYSDVTYILNALQAKAGLVTYHGPNFSSFMMTQGGEYTRQCFRQVLFDDEPVTVQPAEVWSDDAWANDQENRTFLTNEGYWPIHPGKTSGTIVGGNTFCLNLLQGGPYYPHPADTILFLESQGEGKGSLMGLDSSLRALAFQPEFDRVRGIVLGRYPRSARVNRENLTALINGIEPLTHLPVLANCDFGHTTPAMTIPIGGQCELRISARAASLVFSPRRFSKP